ncbi:hypothetical protein GR205_07225 [Rhizobium leguminosarum]|nr:hypothetical protein [Rhizobium ruizarguesonis]
MTFAPIAVVTLRGYVTATSLDTSSIFMKYIPLDVGISIRASASDLRSFSWRTGQRVEASFYVDDPEHLLRITFDGPCIVRIVDEFPLSTEHEDDPAEGLISEHFAYRVEGATFYTSQSETWKTVVSIQVGPTCHYRFITGNTCMDVVTPAKPVFTVIATETEA